MKKLIFIFAICIISSQAFAQAKGTGGAAGIILGEPTGLTFKYNNFPILGLAWSFEDDTCHIHCDYWIVNKNLVKVIDWYGGIGLKYVNTKDEPDAPRHGHAKERHNWLGARVPFGLQFFPDQKVEIFLELVPVLYLFPETDFSINAGIGARFYFF